MFFPTSMTLNPFDRIIQHPYIVASPLKQMAIQQMQYRGGLGVYQEVQVEPLGSGSYGEVRLVEELRTQKLYAMKKMSLQVLKEINAEDNINLEILIQGKLNHPNILKFIEAFGDHQNLYIVLEYCPNGTLTQLIRKQGPLSEEQAFNYFYQILSGIDYLHQNNILHRDIKPDNILISENNIVKICDYNWAVQVDSSQEASPCLCGTTEYMPPEVVMQQTQNCKVDVWSLGIVFYEMLHNDVPYKGRNNQEKITSIMSNPQFQFNKKLSQEAQLLIYSMLSRTLNQRPTIRQIFFSKWVNCQLSNQIANQKEMDKKISQTSRSLETSLVKERNFVDALDHKVKSDVKPKNTNLKLSPVRICGLGNIVVRPNAAPKT